MKQANRVLTFVIFVATGGIATAQSLSPDLHEVTNIKAFKKAVPFKKAHLDALRKNLFFTCPSDDKALYWEYGRNDYQNLPSIVTTDNILQIYHIFFDSILRGVEEKSLYGETRALTKAMLKQANKRYAELKVTPLAGAALKNVAYFGVADRLLGMDDDVAPAAREMVSREVALIKAAEGRKVGAIFPYDLDYSQFIVRGHYSKTPVLGRYFEAMMWYGLAPLGVKVRQNGREAVAYEQIRQSLLMVRDLADSGAQPRWQKIYDTTALFAGKSNNPTPIAWSNIARPIFGAKPMVVTFADKGLIEAFAKAAEKADVAAIHLKVSEGTTPDPVQFRFMGQRAIPDSVIMQRLCDPERRPFPSPLDVFTVMGNDSAKAIIDSNPDKFNSKSWGEYYPERAKLEGEFAALPKDKWSQDLYWSWFDSLRKMPTPDGAKYPAFMKTKAWGDKTLYSSLASWAELRHDTILYGLQTGAEMGDSPPLAIKGYVEPNPAFYGRMEALIAQTRSGLKTIGYADDEVFGEIDRFRDIVRFCRKASETELAGKALTQDEYLRIRMIEGELESAHNQIQKTVSGYNTLTQDDLDIALVADVHTAYGEALTVAVGRADHLYAVAPIEGKLYLTRGSTLSYYEFTVPASKRMTDKQWKERLNSGKAPARPFWVKSFYVPLPLKGKDD